MTDEVAVSQKFSIWRWSPRRSKAARMVAAGELTDTEIANKLGVTRRLVCYWKAVPEFKQRVDAIAKSWGEEADRVAIGKRINRLNALNDRWLKMQQVIAERAADPALQEVAGGKTGLIVIDNYKSEGKVEFIDGKKVVVNQLVPEFAVDTGLLKELREHEKLAALELGQIDSKQQGLTSTHNHITILEFQENTREEPKIVEAEPANDLLGLPDFESME